MTRRLLVGIVTPCAALSVMELPAQSQSASLRGDFGLPAESAGWEAVLAGLLSTFDKADVLAQLIIRGHDGAGVTDLSSTRS
jgi:hypothetical protein